MSAAERQKENKTNMRTTRAAAKRAAADDDRAEFPAQGGGQSKRPALANLTNQGNTQIHANQQASRPQAKDDGPAKSGTASQPRTRAALRKSAGSSADIGTERVPNRRKNSVETENPAQPPAGIPDTSESHKHYHEDAAAAVASLERRTVQNLRISSVRADLNNPVAKGAAEKCSPLLDRRGWSCEYGYVDIDAKSGDAQMCTAYASNIYEHLHRTETKRRPSVDFMEKIQVDINASMRGILVDWLVEVAEEYKLVPDTLYLTCSFIDRFLSGNVVPRSELQLLGVTCMLIAAKYEEIYAPQVDEFCYITDNTYRRDQVIAMERRVLKFLHFEISYPTTKSFLRRFIRAAQADQAPSLQLEFLGNYLSELSLMEYGFLGFLPSLCAASAVYLAKFTLDPHQHPWTPTLQHYSGYRPLDLKECVTAMSALQLNTKGCTLPAIREKYRQPKFKAVSTMQSPVEVPAEYFADYPESLLHKSVI